MVHALASKENTVHGESAIEIVDGILQDAIIYKASDIHGESTSDGLRIRFRLDGMLYDQYVIDHTHARAVISRIKVLALLDIAQYRTPQDGKFRLALKGDIAGGRERIVDVRVATFPGLYGEKIVLRILDRFYAITTLENLGFSELVRERLQQLLKKPQGFFLVTGPTGSGKTTTLYAMLAALNDSTRNIVTMEDPVEYEITGITQSQINTKVDFNFQNGLRSLLRQDPDVIMIGEIRDSATLHMALNAALTGHLVLSTLHTTDSLGTVSRLLDMGAEPYLVSAALSCVLAQQLVRILCEHCKQPIRDQRSEYSAYFDNEEALFFEAGGCERCRFTGCLGRRGLGELLVVSDDIRAIFSAGGNAVNLASVNHSPNFMSMASAARDLVVQGVISPTEYWRVLAGTSAEIKKEPRV